MNEETRLELQQDRMLRWVDMLKRIQEDGYLYMGSPYHHPTDKALMKIRALQAANAAAILHARGLQVFSPVAHGHAMVEAYPLIKNHTSIDHWRALDRAMLTPSKAMLVLMLPYWRESRGLKFETNLSNKQHKTIYHVSYEDILLLREWER